jgi:hypothetical protein
MKNGKVVDRQSGANIDGELEPQATSAHHEARRMFFD